MLPRNKDETILGNGPKPDSADVATVYRSIPWRAQPCKLVPPELRYVIRRSAVLSYLLTYCLNIFSDTLQDIERVWGFDEEEISRLAIRSCPCRITNMFAADACAEKYGDLADIPGFYRCGDRWWLDLDERLAHRGLILPIRDSQRPFLITGVRVFRHLRDDRPFILRVRSERPFPK